ncbi:MAG: potassium channel protein [Pirellulaceae bacterium]
MRTPLERIRIGGFILAMIVVIAYAGYLLLGYDPLGALWMVVVTISSVGYGERSGQSEAVQVFTIFVIVFGMSAAVYTIGGFLQLITEGEIERLLGVRRMHREIEKLSDHVIICGFGRMGQVLAASLHGQSQPLIIVDHAPSAIDDAKADGYLALGGDATDDDVLLAAGIQRAKTLVTVLPSDSDNVFITLTARNLCPELQIIARAEHRRTEKKLRHAGANRVVLPALIGARQMWRLIMRPTTADLMELVLESNRLDMELDELIVSAGCRLADKTVQETEARRKHRLLVVAVKQADGEMMFNPDADYCFRAGDIAIIMGKAADMDHFREEFGI